MILVFIADLRAKTEVFDVDLLFKSLMIVLISAGVVSRKNIVSFTLFFSNSSRLVVVGNMSFLSLLATLQK